jgi:hypothetical protein
MYKSIFTNIRSHKSTVILVPSHVYDKIKMSLFDKLVMEENPFFSDHVIFDKRGQDSEFLIMDNVVGETSAMSESGFISKYSLHLSGFDLKPEALCTMMIVIVDDSMVVKLHRAFYNIMAVSPVVMTDAQHKLSFISISETHNYEDDEDCSILFDSSRWTVN